MQYNLLIESLGVYLPENRKTSQEIVEGCTRKIKLPLERLTGIKERRVAGENEFSLNLSINAVSECLNNSKYAPEDIDLVICSTICKADGPDRLLSLEPSTAIRLIKHFNFKNAAGIDVSNACAGMFTGIKIAHHLLQSDDYESVLVVSGEYISHVSETAQKEIENILDPRLASLTLGDAGAAVILKKTERKDIGFHEIDLATLGHYHPYCIAQPNDKKHGGVTMLTQSIKLASAGIREAEIHLGNIIKRAKWPLEQIDKIIMHQTSIKSIKSGMEAINRIFKKKVCDENNTVINIPERGNTASTTHLVALNDCFKNQKIQSGDSVLFCITASGLTVGTALYTFDDLPERIRLKTQSNQFSQPHLTYPKKQRKGLQKPTMRISAVGVLPELNAHEAMPSTTDIAVLAAEECFKKAYFDRQDVDLVIYTGVYRTDFLFEPAMAAIIAGDLCINKKNLKKIDRPTFAFDVTNGAMGTLNALEIANKMLDTKNRNHVLVTSSEDAQLEGYSMTGNQILGTASAMLLVPSDAGQGFSNYIFRAFPEYLGTMESNILQEHGRTFVRGSVDDSYVTCMQTGIKSVVDELLEETGLQIEDFKWVIAPQINHHFIEGLAAKLKMPISKFALTLNTDKDLYTSSLAYSFWNIFEENKADKGDLGLVISAGSGIQAGCAIYHF
jgi:3-oxoacyl-[acyl-carrier-protein] synthase III